MFLQVWYLSTYPHGTKGSFPPYVWVGAGYYGLDFREQISRHFDRGDVPEGAKGKTDDVLIGVVQVAAERQPLAFILQVELNRPTFSESS
jgi:hypothetical protein